MKALHFTLMVGPKLNFEQTFQKAWTLSWKDWFCKIANFQPNYQKMKYFCSNFLWAGCSAWNDVFFFLLFEASNFIVIVGPKKNSVQILLKALRFSLKYFFNICQYPTKLSGKEIILLHILIYFCSPFIKVPNFIAWWGPSWTLNKPFRKFVDY